MQGNSNIDEFLKSFEDAQKQYEKFLEEKGFYRFSPMVKEQNSPVEDTSRNLRTQERFILNKEQNSPVEDTSRNLRTQERFILNNER